jgi:hypothetical protein
MTKLTGAALDRAVANAMGLKSVNNCEKWGKEMTEDDDDIQEYKKPWVGLTEKEVEDYWDWEDFQCGCGRGTLLEMVRNIEAKLKEKNA